MRVPNRRSPRSSPHRLCLIVVWFAAVVSLYYIFIGGWMIARRSANEFRPNLDRYLQFDSDHHAHHNYQSLAESALSTEFVLRPFDPDKPKFFHLLSYQRCGSSFVGDLFQNMSQVFYIYEPLDALYTAMYGTVGGWNVPSDIFIEPHGQVRQLSHAEREMTEKTLDAIFNCRLSALPFPMLMHRFWPFFRWRMPDVKRFTECASKKVPGVFSLLDKCGGPLREFCGARFNQNTDKAKTCLEILYHNGQWNSSLRFIKDTLGRNHPHILNTTLNSIAVNFVQYFVCIWKHKNKVTSCAAEHLDKSCKNYPIRAVKTVRGFAEVDKALSEKYSNFRLIHLVRDPRGTIESRSRLSWTRGLYEMKDVGKIAEAYCRIGTANDRVREQIEKKYPGKTTRLIFDALMKYPKEYVKNIFRYMGENVTDSTVRWLNELEKKKLKTKKVKTARHGQALLNVNVSSAEKWKMAFAYYEVEALKKNCHDFFNFIQYAWD